MYFASPCRGSTSCIKNTLEKKTLSTQRNLGVVWERLAVTVEKSKITLFGWMLRIVGLICCCVNSWQVLHVEIFTFSPHILLKKNLKQAELVSVHNCVFSDFAGGLRGASIVDSLDTLYIMGLMDEYNDAKEWVKTSLDLNSVRNSF